MPSKKQMKEKESAIRFSLSLQENLLDELDTRIIRNGYLSRSELVHDMIRENNMENSWKMKTYSSLLNKSIAVLVTTYHYQRGLDQRMIDIQHNSSVNILCNTHVYTESCNCLETIILKGCLAKIQKFSLEVGGLGGIKFSKLTKTSCFDKDK
ncbi:ribbon-helix-helix protein, CopG family [Helicobacter cappadocius]|uniref:Putative nickel-responsive regulator n=1 Tax=Helicobacter cappadocius TaxID=3063998 RepID=A0AA90PZZ8_9HELI|nr:MULTISPECIES: ribbon-helix-helix protein, CopG family [unclassified Helicobacter]MDO7253699.1 ribbon-helix-helix protein, CopG family [Helicobacter sp. faydin-H75]MDP2539613.1 ribbon-helix-helix protein, CopG family [Helicobacter sp. faydin-H76]